MNRIFVTLGVLACALSGCNLTTPKDMGNAHRVLLEPLADEEVCHGHLGGSLIISYPEAPDTLNTSRIALIDKDGHWDYFAGMRWADFLPGNIQTALVHSFATSGGVKSVFTDDTTEHSRLTLASEVRKFEAVYTQGSIAPDVEIEMMFTLRETDRLSTKKQFTVSSRAKADANSAAAIDSAFEQAFNEIQHDVIRKALSCER